MRKVSFVFVLTLFCSALWAQPVRLEISDPVVSSASGLRGDVVEVFFSVSNLASRERDVRVFVEISPITTFVAADGALIPCVDLSGNPAVCAARLDTASTPGVFTFSSQSSQAFDLGWIVAVLADLPFEPVAGIYRLRAYAEVWKTNGRLEERAVSNGVYFEVY